MQFQYNLCRRTADIQIHDRNHRQKNTGQIDERKTLELKKTIELIKQKTYEKKNKKRTIPEVLILAKEKQVIKEEPIQWMEKISSRSKIRPTAKTMQILRGT